jgi:hypothetical protein
VTGDVPELYVGTWTAAITNTDGKNTRTLAIRQGRIGDTVLTLTADGPTPKSTYHCVFQGTLTAVTLNSIRISATNVVGGRPASYCTKGNATTLTLEDDNTLRRSNDTHSETITYTRTP